MAPTPQKVQSSVSSERKPAARATAAAASAAKSGRAARKSDRVRVRRVLQPCELRVGDNILPAALMNESRTGFGVLLDTREDVEIGGKVELRTEAGWVTGEVVYIKQVASCLATSSCDKLFQVGAKKTRCYFVS
jgi:hypothetical protein